MTEEPSCVPAPENEVIFFIGGPDNYTRSSLGTDEFKVESLKISAYSDGVLDAEGYFTSFSDMSLRLAMGKTYDFYALANMGDVAFPLSESSVADLVYRISGLEDLSESFPMSWSSAGMKMVQGGAVHVALSRLVAKITVDVDCGDTGLCVRSVALRQTPLNVRPFAESGSRAFAGEVSAGDMSSEQDLQTLNNGGVASFYMLENMQGTLLAGNRDPMRKVPENIQEEEEVCTYLEVGCAFDEGDDREGTVSYRMYLGKDDVSNFDVERNHVLSLSLRLTDEGVGIQDSWKVVSDYIQHAVSVRLDKRSLDMYVGETSLLNAEVLPYDAENKSIRWESGNQDVAVVDDNGLVRAVGKGECVVRAVSADRPDVFAECIVNVLEPYVVTLKFTPSDVNVILGEDDVEKYSYFNVAATYSDGSSSVVTTLCSYSSDSPSARVDYPGIVTHVSEGKAVITAELDGVKAFMTAGTEELSVVGVELLTDNVIISLGDTYVVKFRVIYNDGTVSRWIPYGYIGGERFAAEGWDMSDWSVASVGTYGAITPHKVGQTEVSVSVRNAEGEIYEASASVKVTEAYVTAVRAVMSPMFYSGSSGPTLIGIYSDGTESPLKADSWSVSSPYVRYTESEGLVVSDETALVPGVMICAFTAEYDGLSACVHSVYGKWVLEAGFEKTFLPGMNQYRLRLCLILADLTREYVAFDYELSDDGENWTSSSYAEEDGALVDWNWPFVKARTASAYYDYYGNSRFWTAGLE